MKTATSISTAAALLAAALAAEPTLTVNGFTAGQALTDHDVAVAADFLGACKPCSTMGPSTNVLAEAAAEHVGVLHVSPGALLAAAIGLGIRWERDFPETPYVRLALRPPPRWSEPVAGDAVQALRRLGGRASRSLLAWAVRGACAPRGARPPTRLVKDAIEAAIQSGAIVADGRALRLGGEAS